MGKPKTPTWLSKLKQVGEALKVQTKPGGSPSSSYVSSPRDSGAGIGINNGDESPAGSAGFVRRSLEAPELARSLSLKRAKARAADRSGGATGADPDAAGSPRPAPVSPSSGGTGHRLSRSIDALYALSQKKEEEEAAAAAAAAAAEAEQATPPASGHGTGRNLDQATMALLADSLARTKVAKQKELAERAARAAQQLKARAAAAAAAAANAVSDDSATSSDRPPLGFAARASPSSSSSVQGGGVLYSNAAAARRRPPSVRRSPQRRYGDAAAAAAGASSLCTSEDDRPPFDLPPNATTASMSCSDDAWDNSSRHSRVTGEDAACEVAAGGAGSDVWGSDLFVKLRALKQLYSKDTRQDDDDDDDDNEDGDSDSDTNDARSDFMDDDDDDGWDTSDEASGGDDRHHRHHHLGGDVYMVPGWATPSRAVPTTSRRQQLQASPSRSFAVPRGGDNFMASPSRRNANMGGPPLPPSANRKDRLYRGYDQDDYGGEAQEKLFWKEEPATTTTRRRPGADSKKLRHQQQQQQRSGSKQHNTNLSCFLPTDVSGVVRESVAMVKYSQDPYLDFRHSMAEMILEKDIHQPADLEELLHCYLTLNSPRQYHLIKKAFFDTWNELLSRRSRSFWGAV